jgi:ADP-heptose:LPS heptosyltransferase
VRRRPSILLTTDEGTAAAIWSKLARFAPGINASNKLVVLNPNASKRFPMRQLPLDSYADLARHVLDDPDVYVLVTGVADEKPDAVHICSRANSPRIVDLTGQTTMMELLHLFNLARILITNDSGPAHFACLTGIHVIVFFGRAPDRYQPLRSAIVYTDLRAALRQPVQPTPDAVRRQPLPEDDRRAR